MPFPRRRRKPRRLRVHGALTNRKIASSIELSRRRSMTLICLTRNETTGIQRLGGAGQGRAGRTRRNAFFGTLQQCSDAFATMRLLKNLPRLARRYRRLPFTNYADAKGRSAMPGQWFWRGHAGCSGQPEGEPDDAPPGMRRGLDVVGRTVAAAALAAAVC